MNRYQVRSAEQALAYLIDCTLATVQSMAMKKSRGKYEYERQMEIAQRGINWAVSMGVDLSSTRAEDVCAKYTSVSKWAKDYEVY